MIKKLNILFLFIFFSGIAFSQENDTLAADDSTAIQAIDTAIANTILVTPIPKKWENESAVILELNKSYVVAYSYLYGNYVKEKYRKKILLRDRAAVEAFSEIHFPVSEYENSGSSYLSWSTTTVKKNNFTCKVLKKNGTVIELSSSDAIPMQVSSSKGFYEQVYTYKKKLAVPNLEPGDIIDYEFTTTFSVNNGLSHRIELAETHPILKLTVDFELPDSYFFTQVSIATDKKLEGNKRVRGETRMLHLEMDTLEKWKDELWTYESRSLPSIRYRIEPDYNLTIEKTRDQDKYVQKTLAYELFSNESFKKNKKYTKKILFWLKKNKIKKDNPDTLAAKAYYYFRYLINRDALNGDLYDPLSSKQDAISDALFSAVMLDVLNKSKVPAKQICFVPRNRGKLEDALSPFEYTLAVKAGAGNLFLFNFNNNSVSSEIPENYEGADAFSFSANRNYRKTKFKWILTLNPTFIALPLIVYATESAIRSSHRKPDLSKTKINSGTAGDHIINSIFSFDISKLPVEDKIDVKRVTSRTGNFKNEFNSLLISPLECKLEDQKKFNLAGDRENKLYGTLARNEEVLRVKLKNILDDRLRSYMKDQLESDEMMVENYKKYKVLNSGRFSEKPDFLLEENFSLTNVYNHPEENLIILNAGSIIGQQVTLGENDLKRNNDVYFANSRTISNSISITVPDGFKAINLEDFTFNIANEPGSFVSSASQSGNVITIQTKKIYKTDLVKKEDWNKMIEWLDAAYHFTQKKLFLRK